MKKFRNSENGKITVDRTNTSEKGVARKKRAGKKRGQTMNKRRAIDPIWAATKDLASTASRLISGKYKSSPTFVQRTGFQSEADFVTHVKAMVELTKMKMSEYGDGWVIEHAIPQEAYDFSNADDVKRCWCKANVRVLKPGENKAKGALIIDELCHKVGTAHYPVAWGGSIPTIDEKEAFYAASRLRS